MVMKRLSHFTTSRLLLLGLLALLVFGSCGGGVSGFLHSLGAERRQRLAQVMSQDHRAREAARRRLRGRARLAAYDSITARTQPLAQGSAPAAPPAAGRPVAARRRAATAGPARKPDLAPTFCVGEVLSRFSHA
jgi:hypothetical protein